MKNFVFVSSALMFLSLSASAQPERKLSLNAVIDDALRISLRQSIQMAKLLKDRPGLLPRTTDSSGDLVTCNSKWWTSGFFPGALWYLYEYSQNVSLKQFAEEFTQLIITTSAS